MYINCYSLIKCINVCYFFMFEAEKFFFSCRIFPLLLHFNLLIFFVVVILLFSDLFFPLFVEISYLLPGFLRLLNAKYVWSVCSVAIIEIFAIRRKKNCIHAIRASRNVLIQFIKIIVRGIKYLQSTWKSLSESVCSLSRFRKSHLS